MPDRDIFQRRFKGSGPLGWQGVSHLLNYEPNRLDIDARIAKALARTLRKLPPNFIRNVVRLLRTAMVEEHRNRALRNGNDAFLNLTYNLRIENSGNEFELAEMVKTAAQSFFLTSLDRPLVLNDQGIVAGFAEKLGNTLIDAQLFSKVRDVLMSNSGRDLATEISWEQQIIDRLRPHVRSMLGRYLADADKAFRAPTIRRLHRKSTEEILTELIAVLPPERRRPNVS